MVGFRDWLRTHDDDRALYESTKRDLLKREWKFVQNYADAKGEVVEAIAARAGIGGPHPEPVATRDAALTPRAALGTVRDTT
jgi:hypothetical protein